MQGGDDSGEWGLHDGQGLGILSRTGGYGNEANMGNKGDIRDERA